MTTPTLLTLARACKRAYPNAAGPYSELADRILAGDLDDESRNVEWDDFAQVSYVACVYGTDGDEPGDCYVRVGRTPAGVWMIDDGDDSVRQDLDGPYWSREDAIGAAEELAESQHEGLDGENAASMRARLLAERAGKPDAHGRWCVYWETSLDDEGPCDRYTTREQAEAAAASSNDELHAHNPGALLCGYSVRHLEHGEWVESEE